jgi:hypothetical protein
LFRQAAVAGLVAILTIATAACSRQESAAEASMAERDAAAPAAPMAASVASAEAEAVAQAPAAEASGARANDAFAAKVAEETPDVDTTTRVDPGQVTSSASSYKDATRRFIRTAQAQFRVKDVYASAMSIEDAAAQQGGFVVSNDISAQVMSSRRYPAGAGKLVELTEYAMRGSLTVRVPSDNTQAFLRAIAAQMEFLDQRGFQAADAQFDLLRRQLAWQREQQAQLELGEAVRDGDRLDRKADVIAARSGAKQQRDEALIEQKQFEDQVAFSTITLTLYQSPKLRRTELDDIEAIARKHSPGFFPRLFDALRSGWDGVLEVVIALMHVWPLWLLLGLGAVALRRWWRGSRRMRPASPPPIEG